MLTKTVPFGNNVLVEITREYAGVSRAEGDNEAMNVGILRDYHIAQYHLTASAAIEFSESFRFALAAELDEFIGKTVRWEELAETGQKFDEDGKTYALIPFWRLIGHELQDVKIIEGEPDDKDN